MAFNNEAPFNIGVKTSTNGEKDFNNFSEENTAKYQKLQDEIEEKTQKGIPVIEGFEPQVKVEEVAQYKPGEDVAED